MWFNLVLSAVPLILVRWCGVWFLCGSLALSLGCVCVVCVSLCVLYLVYVSSVWFSVFLCGLCTVYLVYMSSLWSVSLCALFSVCLLCSMCLFMCSMCPLFSVCLFCGLSVCVCIFVQPSVSSVRVYVSLCLRVVGLNHHHFICTFE